MSEILYTAAAIATVGSFVIDLIEWIQKYKQKDDAGIKKSED